MAAERQVRLDPVLERGEPEVVEPPALVLRERLEGDVGECRATPQGERLVEARRTPRRLVRRQRLADEELESRRDLSAFVGSVYLPCRCGEVHSVFVPAVTVCEARG